jgi:hypothetical protein
VAVDANRDLLAVDREALDGDRSGDHAIEARLQCDALAGVSFVGGDYGDLSGGENFDGVLHYAALFKAG